MTIPLRLLTLLLFTASSHLEATWTKVKEIGEYRVSQANYFFLANFLANLLIIESLHDLKIGVKVTMPKLPDYVYNYLKLKMVGYNALLFGIVTFNVSACNVCI